MIYLDHAATTRADREVVEAMLPYFTEYFGNPSGIYRPAAAAKKAVTEARENIAAVLGAKPSEIYFTSGGSEADNWALVCAAESRRDKGDHIITTKAEHHAVLNTCHYLEKRGFRVTYLDTDADGRISIDALEAAICGGTILISVMYANNEIGTIEPVREACAAAHRHGVIFHTDAVQAFGHIPIDVNEDGIDLLSASAHKLYGPKGVGFLYIRSGTRFAPFIRGGEQEMGLRAGTENVAGIVGFGKAALLAKERMSQDEEHIRGLRDYFLQRVLGEIPGTRLNGTSDMKLRLANNANIYFEGIPAEEMLIRLDMEGICASAGAACASGSLDPSHVLLAAGYSREEAENSVRFTLGRDTTREEIDRTVEVLKKMHGSIR